MSTDPPQHPPTDGRSDPAGASPVVVLVFGAAAFVAFAIAGLGMMSLLLDADVIEQPGLGPLPGVVGFVAAVAAWVAVMGPALRRRAGLSASIGAGLAAGAAYAAAVFVGVLFAGSDPAIAAAVAWRLVTAGFAAVVAIAGILVGTGAAVAVRTPDRPRWPWEGRADDRPHGSRPDDDGPDEPGVSRDAPRED